MQLCYNEATTLCNSTLEQDLVLCEKFGYDLIEIRLDKLREYLLTHTVADLKAFFAQSRLKPFAFNALEGIHFRTPRAWEELMEGLDLFCRVGREINCAKVVVVPTPDVGHRTMEEIKAASLESICKIDQRAKANGWPVQQALEFVGYPNLCINTLGQAWDIVVEADADHVGIVLDCFHFHAMNSHWQDLEQLDISKLFILHIDDSENLPVGALRDEHRLWPGDGAVDLDRIFSILKQKGYDAMASVELFRPEYYNMPAEDTIRMAREKSLQVLARQWRVG